MHYTIQGKVTIEGHLGLQDLGEALFLRVYDHQALLEAPQFHLEGQDGLWTEADLDGLTMLPLAREPLGHDGTFEIEIDDRQHAYHGGTLLAILEVSYMPPMLGLEAAHPVAYLPLSLLQPRWNPSGPLLCALACKLSITAVALQLLMQHFEVQCISGLLVVQSTQLPIAAGLVTAYYDALELGHCKTGEDGAFAIWYRGPRKTEPITLLSQLGTQEVKYELPANHVYAGSAENTPLGMHLSMGTESPGPRSRNGDDDLSHARAPQMSLCSQVRPPMTASHLNGHAETPFVGTAEPYFWTSSSHQPRFYPN